MTIEIWKVAGQIAMGYKGKIHTGLQKLVQKNVNSLLNNFM